MIDIFGKKLEGLKYPRNYQARTSKELIDCRFKALLADMGTGKTIMMLQALQSLKTLGKLKGVLLIAPKDVCDLVWPVELKQEWNHIIDLNYVILRGQYRDLELQRDYDLYITNREQLKWLYSKLWNVPKKDWPFDILLIDESSIFKNPKMSGGKTACTWFGYIKKLIPFFNRRYIMTGTPGSKGYLDLWSQLHLVHPDIIGMSFSAFRSYYFERTIRGKKESVTKDGKPCYSKKQIMSATYQLREQLRGELEKKIAPYVIRLAAKDYIEMPEPIINDVYCQAPKSFYVYYKEMERKFIAEIDGDTVTAANKLVSFIKCQQFVGGAVYQDETIETYEDIWKLERKAAAERPIIKLNEIKLKKLEQILSDNPDERFLIAYTFKHEKERIAKMIQDKIGDDLRFIGSGMTRAEKIQSQDDWNSGKVRLVLMQSSSTKYGLNLQKLGGSILWYAQTWSPDTYNQLNARILRQNVPGIVRIHRLLIEDTIDEMMLHILQEGKATEDSVLNAMRKYYNTKLKIAA
jgi:SNF2 family DNA or RNA helicase